jgi:hypothetical protein
VVVHEFVHHAVSEEERSPQLFNDRSKLWRVLLPPDQLNPEGYMDARLDYFSPLEVSAGPGEAGEGVRGPRGGLWVCIPSRCVPSRRYSPHASMTSASNKLLGPGCLAFIQNLQFRVQHHVMCVYVLCAFKVEYAYDLAARDCMSTCVQQEATGEQLSLCLGDKAGLPSHGCLLLWYETWN